MSSTKKRSSKGPSSNTDFKRLKAKVGKRAPKKLNSTNTSVSTKNLKIARQGGVVGYEEGGEEEEIGGDDEVVYRTVGR